MNRLLYIPEAKMVCHCFKLFGAYVESIDVLDVIDLLDRDDIDFYLSKNEELLVSYPVSRDYILDHISVCPILACHLVPL